MQRYVNDVKADISREMELDELRKLQASVQDAAHAIEQTVNKEIKSTESELNSIATSAEQALQPAADPAPAIEALPPAATTPAAEPAVQGQLDLGSEAVPPVRKQG
jgi:sec-independent protein translocase protein TatB